MKIVALCVGSILHQDKYALADRIVRAEYAAGNRVALVPAAMARSAVQEEGADFLYFLCGGVIDECRVLPGETMDEGFIEALRALLESHGIPLTVVDADAVSGSDEAAMERRAQWPGRVISSNEGVAGRVFHFTNAFLAAEGIDDVAAVCGESIPGGTFLCVRESFLQDIYAERGPMPGMDEPYYILADRRGDGAGSGDRPSCALRGLFPQAREVLEAHTLTMIVPVQSRKAYFGYLVYPCAQLDETAASLELSAVILDLTIGRYLTERQLLFASHELVSAQTHVRRLQETDVLTGLLNRQGFMAGAQQMFDHARATGQQVLAVCIDLDRLGNINDVYGHQEGDYAIQTLSQILQESLFPGMIAARVGSDEFIMMRLLGGDELGAELYFKTLRSRIDNYNLVTDKEYTIDVNTSSIVAGVGAHTSVEEVIEEAFAKKRHIKESRGSRRNVNNLEDVTDDAAEHALVSRLLDENAFRYAFQPIISTHTGEIVAYEALMRTRTEQHVSPLTVLKYATMDERLYDVEQATFTNVFKQLEAFGDALGDRKVFVNSIPGHYLNDTDYQVIRHKYGRFYPNLVVEITEQTDFEDASVDILRRRSTNDVFEVAVDDFGTGYSNLANLLKFLPNYVKIDRALIEGVQEDPKKQHFVKNIIEFAHDNGFQALAEGVECPEELTAVVRMGVDLIQGYYTAKPDFTLTQTISATIRDEIVRANFEGVHDMKKKVYLVNREKELFLMHLAMERYTGIIVSQPELTIHGNPDFMAGITIKIKEGTDCALTIRNVCFGDVDDRPIIDVGVGARLTLIVEGNNLFAGNGVHVPEGASLRLIGDGNLRIAPVLAEAYGIGADGDSHFGDILCRMEGTLSISADGNRSIGIGGGVSKGAEGLQIQSGKLDLMLSGTACVGIGAYRSDVAVRIRSCNLRMDAQISAGILIGSLMGEQDVEIHDAAVHLTGSGSTVVGIGTYEETGGRIYIENASLRERFNGRKIHMLGTQGGDLRVEIANTDVDMLAEGNMALGVGTVERTAQITLRNTRLYIVMRAGQHVEVGAAEGDVRVESGTHKLLVNEQEVEL